MLRYSKLTDAQILAKLLEVCEKEKVEYTEDGMEAVIFTSQASIQGWPEELSRVGVNTAYFDLRQLFWSPCNDLLWYNNFAWTDSELRKLEQN